ncbi:MAG: glycosyltransferase family 39 protein [Deltaproteobacteria bacterium]|nr:glycosyltransferase family 39 protein [Deltaproteobacteria bacterium]
MLPEPEGGAPRAARVLAGVLIFAAASAVTVYLRAPMIDDIVCDLDIGATAYSTQFLTEPGSIYGNAIETKPPGTYILFHLLFSLFGRTMLSVNGFSIVYHLACLLLVFLIALRTSGFGSAAVAALLYAGYSTSVVTHGVCPNFETWTILPALGALYVLLIAFTQSVQRKSLIVLAGALAAVSASFKQPAALLGAAFLIAAAKLAADAPSRRKVVGVGESLGLFAAGAFAGAVPYIVILAAYGGLGAAWNALNPWTYRSYAGFDAEFLQMQWHEFIGPFLWKTKILLVLAALGLLRWPRTAESPRTNYGPGAVLGNAYLAASVLAVFSGTKFYDHYFILLIPPLCLTAARFFGRVFDAENWLRRVADFVVVLTLAGAAVELRLEEKVAAEAVTRIAASGRSDLVDESELFWSHSPTLRFSALSRRVKELGACLRDHSAPDDKLYVWNYIPALYFYADRRAPTRQFMYFNVAVNLPPGSGRWHTEVNDLVLSARRELINNFRADPPLYVVYFAKHRTDIPWLHFTLQTEMFDELRRFVDDRYDVDPYCTDQYFVVLRDKERMP